MYSEEFLLVSPSSNVAAPFVNEDGDDTEVDVEFSVTKRKYVYQ